MKKAIIHVDYQADITIIQKDIAIEIRKSHPLNWTYIIQEESPFKDWDEKFNCWYSNSSSIYIGVLSEKSFDQRKNNTVFLHIYPNVPMWNMEREIKNLIKQLGVVNPRLSLPNYVRAVAQGALRLLEFSE